MISLADAVNALAPVMLITAIGWLLARFRIVEDAGWRGFETLAYNVFFPTIIVYTLLRADFATLPFGTLGIALFLSLAVMGAALILLKPLLEKPLRLSGPRFTSVLQGATRWNSFIGLAIGANLYGDDGLALMAVAVVALIPLTNLLSVSALTLYADGPRPSLAGFARSLALNPFIIACAVGISLKLLEVPVPVAAMTTLETLGRSALAAGILAVGAGLDLSVLRKPGGALALAVAARLVGMPLLAAGFAHALGVTGMALGVAIVATAVPSSSASYVLARKMGGDARLMAEILTLQTLASIATMPLAMTVLT